MNFFITSGPGVHMPADGCEAILNLVPKSEANKKLANNGNNSKLH